MKNRKMIAALLILISIMLVASSAFAAGKKLNTAKIKNLFQQNSDGDWVFTFQTNSSDCITSISIQLSPQGDGTFVTGIYGFFYDKSYGQFRKTTDYAFIIDGHKYSFQESPVTISFGTSLGKAECAYVVHSLINKMLKEIKNAKEVKIQIGFEMGNITGISVVHTYSGKDSGLKTLKSAVNALIAANYFDNLSTEPSVFEDMITATESYE